jgi:hypothetical protein
MNDGLSDQHNHVTIVAPEAWSHILDYGQPDVDFAIMHVLIT